MLATAPKPASQPLRILVADDDDDLRTLLITGLEVAGYRTFELEDGYELSDYLELSNRQVSRRLQPDVIITDLQMPGRSGLEVLREARQEGLTCPCIIISGYANADLRAAVQPLGSTQVLAKPFAIAEVLELVARMTGRPPPGPNLAAA